MDFLPRVAKILGARTSISIYSKADLTKTPLAKADYFYKHLALGRCPSFSTDEKQIFYKDPDLLAKQFNRYDYISVMHVNAVFCSSMLCPFLFPRCLKQKLLWLARGGQCESIFHDPLYQKLYSVTEPAFNRLVAKGEHVHEFSIPGLMGV